MNLFSNIYSCYTSEQSSIIWEVGKKFDSLNLKPSLNTVYFFSSAPQPRAEVIQMSSYFASHLMCQRPASVKRLLKCMHSNSTQTTGFLLQLEQKHERVVESFEGEISPLTAERLKGVWAN